jgi:hypothetical protein
MNFRRTLARRKAAEEEEKIKEAEEVGLKHEAEGDLGFERRSYHPGNNNTNLNGDNFNFSNKNRNETQYEHGGGFELPEFLKKADNEQFLQMFIRMRQRHVADGAVSLNIEPDDIADHNLELYDNKGINIEPPNINENLVDNMEYYIESINRDKYYKISKEGANELVKEEKDSAKEIEKLAQQGKKHKHQQQLKRKPTHIEDEITQKAKTSSDIDIGRLTEEELFSAFDVKLTEIINKSTAKVNLLFLFTQGLLAGISLMNILLLMQYSDFTKFLPVYSTNVREIFNFTHALTFCSLVGNGITFISSYQRCIK